MELTNEEKEHFIIVNRVIDKYISTALAEVLLSLERKYKLPNSSAIIATNDLQRDYLEREFY